MQGWGHKVYLLGSFQPRLGSRYEECSLIGHSTDDKGQNRLRVHVFENTKNNHPTQPLPLHKEHTRCAFPYNELISNHFKTLLDSATQPRVRKELENQRNRITINEQPAPSRTLRIDPSTTRLSRSNLTSLLGTIEALPEAPQDRQH